MTGRRANHEGTKPRRRADGRFQVNVMIDRRWHSAYGTTAAEARRKAKKLVEDHQRGLDLDGGRLTLEAFLNDWLRTTVKRKRDNTYRSYESAVRVHILPNPESNPLGQLTLAKLRPADVDGWIANRRAAGLAPYTLWRLHAILRAGLNRAVKRDPPILLRNPASMVDPIDIDEDAEEVNPLSAQEARRVLEATAGTPAHALYAVALGCGVRQGELLGLRWASSANDPGIDLDRGEVRVYVQIQHGRVGQLKRSWHRRILPLSPWLVAVLERHMELLKLERQLGAQRWHESNLVFPSGTGRPQRAGNVWKSWTRLQVRVGLPHHTFHDLRHTFATLALQGGVPLWKVSKMLGHRDISITQRVYGHLTPEGRDQVAEQMEAILGPQVEGIRVKLGSGSIAVSQIGTNSEMEMVPIGVPGGE